MLIKPINAFLKEVTDPATMDYLGMVEDNNDPEKLGRIRVRISPYMDFESTEDLPWACPILGSCGNSANSGGLNIPEVGSQVRVFFPSHDLTAPYYRGAELNEFNRTTFFDDNYPNTYGYKDSTGNFYKIDKANKTIQFQHSSSSNLRVAPDGSMQVALSNGAYFTFSNQNAFEISIGTVTIKAMPNGDLMIKANQNVNVSADNIIISCPNVAFSGNVSVGNGVTDDFTAGDKTVHVTAGIITGID